MITLTSIINSSSLEGKTYTCWDKSLHRNELVTTNFFQNTVDLFRSGRDSSGRSQTCACVYTCEFIFSKVSVLKNSVIVLNVAARSLFVGR